MGPPDAEIPIPLSGLGLLGEAFDLLGDDRKAVALLAGAGAKVSSSRAWLRRK